MVIGKKYKTLGLYERKFQLYSKNIQKLFQSGFLICVIDATLFSVTKWQGGISVNS